MCRPQKREGDIKTAAAPALVFVFLLHALFHTLLLQYTPFLVLRQRFTCWKLEKKIGRGISCRENAAAEVEVELSGINVLSSSLFTPVSPRQLENFSSPSPLLLLRFPGKHAARHTRGHRNARASSFPPARSLYVLLLHFCAINRSLAYRDRSKLRNNFPCAQRQKMCLICDTAFSDGQRTAH